MGSARSMQVKRNCVWSSYLWWWIWAISSWAHGRDTTGSKTPTGHLPNINPLPHLDAWKNSVRVSAVISLWYAWRPGRLFSLLATRCRGCGTYICKHRRVHAALVATLFLIKFKVLWKSATMNCGRSARDFPQGNYHLKIEENHLQSQHAITQFYPMHTKSLWPVLPATRELAFEERVGNIGNAEGLVHFWSAMNPQMLNEASCAFTGQRLFQIDSPH